MAKRKKAQPTDGSVVRLRHQFRDGDWQLYFYEGEVDVRDGVAAIPADYPHWIRNAYIKGFRLDVDGQFIDDLEGHIAAETGQAQQVSAKSAEDDDEGASGGGQSPDGDGLRPSEPSSDSGLPEEGLDSGDGDGAAVRGEGD